MRIMLILLMILWAGAFFGSALVVGVLPAERFGITSGSERLMALGLGQGAAMMLAMLCLLVRWSTQDAWLRRWSLAPALCMGLALAGFVALYFINGAI